VIDPQTIKSKVKKAGIFPGLFVNGKREAGETSASDGTMVLDSASDNPENTEVDWPLADGIYDVYLRSKAMWRFRLPR
jgi:hypothetical protein